VELKNKPDMGKSLQRIEAWFNGELLDRPPVRFSQHNADFSASRMLAGRTWKNLKEKWFDAEFQVEFFIQSIKGITFYGETFPVFWPNLGPNVYAAFHGAELTFGEVTSWIEHCIDDCDDIAKLQFSTDNQYFRQIENMTKLAIERAEGNYVVGYTDLHGSLDCVADWRDPQRLCLDLIDNPAKVHELVNKANKNFLWVFDYFDSIIKKHGHLSVTWMGIPSRGKMHIPSCDFGSLISEEYFKEFYFPSLCAEVKHMDHNIFHLDGKGMIRHLDMILSVPQVHAIQWVQGVGADAPIMQWISLIKRVQRAGKGVVVDLQIDELDDFMREVRPNGIYLCIAAQPSVQQDIIKRLLKWK